MPRDYSLHDIYEPRRILVLDEQGNTINIIWASIDFCLDYFESESLWQIEPPPMIDEPLAEAQ